MRDSDAQKMRSLKLFASLSQDTFAILTRGSMLQTFPAEGNLIFEADRVDFLYILLEGIVELEGRWHDKETTLAILRPISTFMMADVVLDVPALMSAKTLTRSSLIMLPGESFRSAMQADASFAIAVAQELSGCYRGLVRTIKNQKLRPGVVRLANYLITQMVRQGGVSTIELPHEKRILASLLDLTPESLSRAFQALAKYDVSVSGARVSIGNEPGLRRLARPHPLIDNHTPPKDHYEGKAEKEIWPLTPDRTCGDVIN
jgi:CRP/FNR family transcriptional regulator, transcriptional activator FtrB